MPCAEAIPEYALRAFHNLPNGNYSHNVVNGYARGFELAMLGLMTQARAQLAAACLPAARALDVGTGAGHTAIALHQAGAAEVIGLDLSPYMLQLAARRAPQLRWQHGLAEDLPFAPQSFDAVSFCFVLHELPRDILRRTLREAVRVLRPGGRLALLEPSPVQLTHSLWQVLRQHGPRGLYFWLFAHFIHEPYVRDWHNAALHEELQRCGLRVVRDDISCPFRFLIATKERSMLSLSAPSTQTPERAPASRILSD